jgi:hypothetical protein
MIGTLLSAPLIFAFWQLWKSAMVTGYTPSNYMMAGLAIAAFAESVGEGLMLVGAYAYICHEATGLSNGRRFGSTVLVMQFSLYFVDFWVYLGTGNAFWLLWGGVLCGLIALAWYYMPEEL